MDEKDRNFLTRSDKVEAIKKTADSQAEIDQLQTQNRNLLLVSLVMAALVLIALVAWQQAETAQAKSEKLSLSLRASELSQRALVVNIQDQLPQLALLLGVEAAGIISPSHPSALPNIRTLLGSIGGMPYRGYEGDVMSVAYSPDGKTLASASWDNTIRLWQDAGQR